MYLGVDIGSASSKAVITDNQGRMLACGVVNRGTGSDAGKRVVELVQRQANLTADDIQYSVVTGYGRFTFSEANEQMSEITCHGRGIVNTLQGVRTLIDVGGQDAKVIALSETGKVSSFMMNEKCAAGTGRFIEVMANILECDLKDLSDLAEKAKEEVQISNICTVFAESEVISRLSEGVSKADIADGIHRSVAKRIAGLAARLGVYPQVAMDGGTALNRSLVAALEKELGCEILVPPQPQIIGAYGAALYAQERHEKF